MLIDVKGQNVGMVWGIPSNEGLSQGQSTSFSGILNEDPQNANTVAFKMTVGWRN